MTGYRITELFGALGLPILRECDIATAEKLARLPPERAALVREVALTTHYSHADVIDWPEDRLRRALNPS